MRYIRSSYLSLCTGLFFLSVILQVQAVGSGQVEIMNEPSAVADTSKRKRLENSLAIIEAYKGNAGTGEELFEKASTEVRKVVAELTAMKTEELNKSNFSIKVDDALKIAKENIEKIILKEKKAELYQSYDTLRKDASEEKQSEYIRDIILYISQLGTRHQLIDDDIADHGCNLLFKLPAKQAIKLISRYYKSNLLSNELYASLMLNFIALDEFRGEALSAFFFSARNLKDVLVLVNEDVHKFIGEGRVVKKHFHKFISRLYKIKRNDDVSMLAYYAAKTAQVTSTDKLSGKRRKTSLVDLFRMFHIKPEDQWLSSTICAIVHGLEEARNKIERFTLTKKDEVESGIADFNFLTAVSHARNDSISEEALVALIEKHKLEPQNITTAFQNNLAVNRALIKNMGHQALLRNLGRYTSLGLLSNESVKVQVINKLRAANKKVSLTQLIVSREFYKSGQSPSSDTQWLPDEDILSELDDLVQSSIRAGSKVKLDKLLVHLVATPSLKTRPFKEGSALLATSIMKPLIDSISGDGCVAFDVEKGFTVSEEEILDEQTQIDSNNKLTVMILLDVTASMKEEINGVKSALKELFSDIDSSEREKKRSRKKQYVKNIRAGIVAYDDLYKDKNNTCSSKKNERFNDIWYFSPTDNYEALKNFVHSLRVVKGADFPEDVAGGLEVLNTLLITDEQRCLPEDYLTSFSPEYPYDINRSYASKLVVYADNYGELVSDPLHKKLVIHITDSIPHGKKYFMPSKEELNIIREYRMRMEEAGYSVFAHDNFFDGDPFKRDPDHYFKNLLKGGASYYLINTSTLERVNGFFNQFNTLYEELKQQGALAEHVFFERDNIKKDENAIKEKIKEKIMEVSVGQCAGTHKIDRSDKSALSCASIKKAVAEKMFFENMLVFTDEKSCLADISENVRAYKKSINPDIRLFLVPLTPLSGKVPEDLKGNIVTFGLTENMSDQIYLTRKILDSFRKKTPPPDENTGIYEEILCPVCFDDITGTVAFTTCGHAFHFECIKEWLSLENTDTCPICRTKQTIPSITLYDNKVNTSNPVPMQVDVH